MKKFYLLMGIVSALAFLPFTSKAQDAEISNEGQAQREFFDEEWFAQRHMQGSKIDFCSVSHEGRDFLLKSDLNNGSPRLEIQSKARWWRDATVAMRQSLTISAGKYHKKFSMPLFPERDDIGNGVAASLTIDEMKDLLDTFETEKSTTVLFGSQAKLELSLFQSKEAFKSFRDCTKAAGIADLRSIPKNTDSPPIQETPKEKKTTFSPLTFLSKLLGLGDSNEAWIEDLSSGAWTTGHLPFHGYPVTCLSGTEMVGQDEKAGLFILEVNKYRALSMLFQNEKWKLLPNTKGRVTILGKNYKHVFLAQNPTNSNILVSYLEKEEMKDLLDFLTGDSEVYIFFGNKTINQLLVKGRQEALNKFRTCARDAGVEGLGSNLEISPF